MVSVFAMEHHQKEDGSAVYGFWRDKKCSGLAVKGVNSAIRRHLYVANLIKIKF